MMRKFYVKYVAILTGAMLLLSFVQADYALLLKSGKQHLPEGQIEQTLHGPTHQGSYFRIMQFYALPTDAKKAAMEKMGIVFHSYLPKNAYFVSIPATVKAVQLSQYNIRTIAELTSDMKLSTRLAKGEIPYWADLGGGKIGLVVAFLPGLSETKIDMVLNDLKLNYSSINHKDYRRVIGTASTIDKLAKNPNVLFIQEDEAPGEPENFRARTDHRVNAIQANYNGAPNYDGSGIKVAVGDDGDIGPHIDYSGRLTSYAGQSNGDHGDHVAGTVFGAGNVNPRGRGMAPGAEVAYFDYSSGGQIYLTSADTFYTSLGVSITQSSYSNGLNAGYTPLTQLLDEQVHDYKSLIHVFSSGNSGTSNGGWYNVTGGHKVGKNVIATGNLLWDDQLATSSSRGPAHDGRIKPEVCAVGTNVFSTIDGNNYGLKTGTSMASPGVSGTLATLYHAYKENNNQAMPYSGLMKAILMNTAEDIGNPGPDFKHGFGRINAMRAAQTIEDNQWMMDSVSQGQTDSLTISIPANVAQVKIMVHWTDPEATINTSRALVNDLNFTFYNGSYSQSWQPWVLNTASTAVLNANATRGADSINNVEQVTVNNPPSGDYHLTINGHSVPQGPQRYFVTYTFIMDDVTLTHPIGGEHFNPSQNEIIRWDASSGTGTFKLEYSTDNGSSYTTIANNIPGNINYYDWNVPNVVSGQALVRVSRGTQSDVSNAPFSIIGIPNNLNIVWACPDSLLLTWNAVANATGYEVSKLGNKYMDSTGTSITNQLVVKNVNPTKENWFAVRALGPNGCVGQRSIAYFKAPGTFGCNISTDALLEKVVSPQVLPSCQGLNNVDVTIEVNNSGQQNIFDIPLAYQLAGGAIVRDTLDDTLIPGVSQMFTFSTPMSVVGSGTFNLLVFSELTADQNKYNDTLHHNFDVFPSTLQTVPFIENFDSFNQCGTQNNCEATVCNLSNGWNNPQNGVADDIDFRTNSGTTVSTQTGPASDHTTGTSAGNYLYLEASGGCDVKTAMLLTPCFDLTNINSPQASIWYNMYGVNMGELHVDILADGTWTEDVILPIVGNQGTAWQKLTFNLLPYVGKTITIRFRGITGNGYASDLALDDFQIEDLSGPPVAGFSAARTNLCLNSTTTFSDNTLPVANSWKWTITPATHSYVAGTADTSQSPEVLFTALGLYTVKLKVTNTFGADSIVQTNYIDVSNGQMLPLQEDFQGAFPPANWQIINPDGQTTWQKSGPITGANGISTTAAYMDNFNYNNNGELDHLEIERMDLNGISSVYLVFDVAYARYSNLYNDGLRVDVSTDCGATFTTTSYSKQGSALATVPDQTSQFTPGSAQHWRRDSVDLSAYAGDAVILRFVSMSYFGNNLFIDNVNIVQGGVAAPVAMYGTSADTTCVNQMVTFTSQSTGNIDTYTWNFGVDATPATATTAGPHQVMYSSPGNKTATLTVTNTGGISTQNKALKIYDVPSVGITATNNDTLTVQFTDNSTQDPTSWTWNFGDGNTSNLQNPTHQYAQGGVYSVNLMATNSCGSSDSTFMVNVSGIGVKENVLDQAIVLHPNPAAQVAWLRAEFAGEKTLTVELYDVTGKLLRADQWRNASTHNAYELRLENIPAGVYLVKLSNPNESTVKRLIIQK